MPTFSAAISRSAATGGSITQFDYLNDQFSMEEARLAMMEVKANQKFWYGDFYPLTRAGTGPDAFAAWQLHRADLGAGIVLAFRRSECPFPALQTGLHALKAGVQYKVEVIDEARNCREQTVSGRELLSDFELRLPKKATSLLLRYREGSSQGR